MPRPKKTENRGGARQGTPGHTYSNRTDLMQNYGPGGDPALGNMAPNPSDVQTPRPSAYPEDTPMLLDPTQRPDEPITAGLPVGAGPGPSQAPDTEEWNTLTAKLPDLKTAMEWPDTPSTFKALISYLENR